MGILHNFIERKREREQGMKQAEDNDKIFSDIERKKLSHNEREILGILKREREEHLKDALRWEERRRKGDEMLHEREMMGRGFNLLENGGSNLWD